MHKPMILHIYTPKSDRQCLGAGWTAKLKYTAYPAWLAMASAERGVSFSQRRVRSCQGKVRQGLARPHGLHYTFYFAGREGQKELLPVTLLLMADFY